MKNLISSAIIVGMCLTGSALAAVGNADNGKEIYLKRCVWCHGVEGDGSGVGPDRLNPPPRDFTSGMYKIKTSGFDDMVPNDEDLFRMIKFGMPGNYEAGKTPMNPGGTAMPGWGDMLSDQEIWDLVEYVKVLSEYQEEKPEQPQLDYGTQVASSPESIAKGKELFLEGDRCAECHGQTGKGSGIKALKSDAGERTWPRNLTKAWTYRASSDPKDVFIRITTGIPGTQMPSFADPISKMKLSVEDRWHVANYVSSIAEAGGDKQPNPENIVVKVAKAEGGLPADPNDPAWDSSTPSNFFLIPQFIGKERLFTPSNDSITVRALYDESEIAILLEWDDRTKSIPGDTAAITVADPNEVYEDSVAVQFPMEIPKGVQKPYFGMGDAGKPVNIWQWKSGTTDKPESVGLMNSTGFANIERRDAAGSGITVKGAYDNGVWRVVIKRPLTTAEADKDIQFEEGKFIPAAFAVWDGSNNEKGSKHTTTAWYWLILEPPTGSKPYLMALLVMVLIGGGQFWWARSANPKKT